MNETIINITVLNLFFNNYSQDHIKELCQDREFNHFWNSKRHEYKSNGAAIRCTAEQLWKGFTSYLEPETQLLILEVAERNI